MSRPGGVRRGGLLLLFALGCRTSGKAQGEAVDTADAHGTDDTAGGDDTGDTEEDAPPCPVHVAIDGAADASGHEHDPVGSIARAMDIRAADCLDIWVGPGTHAEDVDYGTAELRLLGVEGAVATTLRGTGAGPVVTIAGGQAAAELVGFRLTGGAGRPGDGEALRADATWGGGLVVEGASVQLEDLLIDDNQATGGGGGVLLHNAAAVVDEVIVGENRVEATGAAAGGGVLMIESALDATTLLLVGNTITAAGAARGGGLAARAAELRATDLVVESNRLDGISEADESGGAGLAAISTALHLDGATLLGNALTCAGAGVDALGGGALLARQSTVELRRVSALGNQASGAGCHLRGGGVALEAVDGTLDGVDLRDNGIEIQGDGTAEGGGLSIRDASPSLSGLVLAGNHLASASATDADLRGAGLWLDQTSPELRRSTLHGNHITATDTGTPTLAGAGLYLTESAPGLIGVLITGNRIDAGGAPDAVLGAGGVHPTDSAAPAISYSDRWGNAGEASAEAPVPAEDGNLMVDPRYIDAASEHPVEWDLSLEPGSPCIDAGDPGATDPDGSRADMGAPG